MRLFVPIGLVFFLVGCTHAQLNEFEAGLEAYNSGQQQYYNSGQQQYYSNPPSAVTGFLRSQKIVGGMRQCVYNVLGRTVIKSQSIASICRPNAKF